MGKIKILVFVLLLSSHIMAQKINIDYYSGLDSVLTCSVCEKIPGLVAAVCIDGKIAGMVDNVYRVLAEEQGYGNNIEEIHLAVKDGNLDKVKKLLSVTPDLLNARDKIGHTPLSLSAVYAKWDIFWYLLNEGADVYIITQANTTALHAVCQHERPDMAALLLQKGGDFCLEVKDVYGEYTTMLRAVQSGCKNMVEFLLKNGARPDEVTKEGWNALHLAAKCGHRHLYGMLIGQGVSEDAADKEGKKPMEYDFRRPDPIPLAGIDMQEYTGRYTWEGAPDGFFITVYINNAKLILDDYSVNELYPIGKDMFYCTKNPWEVRFLRA